MSKLMKESHSSDLSSQNYGELFSTQDFWFVDDTYVHRKTYEGDTVTTESTNGAVFIFNPRTGQLFLKIIHTNAWAEENIGELGKRRTAEEVAALLRPRLIEDHPKQIIVARNGMLQALQANLRKFPHIFVRGCELKLPFQACMKIGKFSDLIATATEPKMLVYNLYDDWLPSISSYNAFSRLILILRALGVKNEEAKSLLLLDRTEGTNVWGSLSDHRWMRAEVKLRDLIISDYACKNDMQTSDLTQSDIRDIILGAESTPTFSTEAASDGQQ